MSTGTSLRERLGRAGRLSAAMILLFAGLLPAAASAQSIGGPAPAPPPISNPSADNAYPHVDTVSVTGKSTRAVKTTMTSIGVEALADRILLTVQRGLSAA